MTEKSAPWRSQEDEDLLTRSKKKTKTSQETREEGPPRVEEMESNPGDK